MAAFEPYGDFIRELFDNGKTHDKISSALKQSGAPKCSVMTVRRFFEEKPKNDLSVFSDFVLNRNIRTIHKPYTDS